MVAVHEEPCTPKNIDDANLDVEDEVIRTNVNVITINQMLPLHREILDDEVASSSTDGEFDSDTISLA